MLFSQTLSGFRGKTVRHKPEHAVIDYVQIPQSLIETNKLVTLTTDVMLVNNSPFVVIIGWGIALLTAEFTPIGRAKKLTHNLNWIITLYSLAGFRVQTIIMDVEFNKVKKVSQEIFGLLLVMPSILTGMIQVPSLCQGTLKGTEIFSPWFSQACYQQQLLQHQPQKTRCSRTSNLLQLIWSLASIESCDSWSVGKAPTL